MKSKVSLAVCAIGLFLILVGLFTSVPGTYLTTIESLDGDKSSYHDDRYSSIEEYVGGDAYNYIIGASLVGGRIAGAKAQKAIFISAGALIVSLGALSYVYFLDDKKDTGNSVSDIPNVSSVNPGFNNAISSFIESKENPTDSPTPAEPIE